LKQLVAPGKAQCFLDACIKALQRMHKQNNFTDRQKIGQVSSTGRYKALNARSPRTLFFQRFFDAVAALSQRVVCWIRRNGNFFSNTAQMAGKSLQGNGGGIDGPTCTPLAKKKNVSPPSDEYIAAWDVSLQALESAFGGNDALLAHVGEQLAKFWECADRQSSLLALQEPDLATKLNSIYQQSVSRTVESNRTIIDYCLKRLAACRHDRIIPLPEWLQLQRTRDMAERLIEYASLAPATMEATLS
jgi:hypothetical protein